MSRREAILRQVAERVECGSWQLDRCPGDLALVLARLAAEARPIGWYPGWHFGTGESSTDCLVQLRKRLWNYFASRRAQASFVMRWYDDLKVWLYPGNDLSWMMFVGGCFEPNEFTLLNTVLQRGMTLIDVGANDGLYSLFAAKHVGPSGKVMALEPSKREFGRLKRNLALNQLKNVHALELAASDHQGEAVLSIADYGHEGQNTLGAFIYDVGLLRNDTVRLAPLDSLARQERLEQVHVIKMDVEGAEFSVLEGARETIARDHPLMIIELHDSALRNQGSSGAALLEFLSAQHYEIFVFDPASGRPVPGELPAPEDPNIVAVHRSMRAVIAECQENPALPT